MAMRITGVDRVLKAMGKARTADAINIQEGLRKCGEIILKKAKEYVPKKTRALENSGVTSARGSGFGASGTVEFGGPTAPYAFAVHEILGKYHAPPTCAIYLERAVRESRGTCTAMLKRQFTAGPGKA